MIPTREKEASPFWFQRITRAPDLSRPLTMSKANSALVIASWLLRTIALTTQPRWLPSQVLKSPQGQIRQKLAKAMPWIGD